MKNFKGYFLFVFLLSIILTSFVSFNKAVAVDTCPGVPTVSYGGKIYNTVLIGTQCWLKENLDIGTMILGTQEQTNNNVVEKYCYNNIGTNCTERGALYQWAETVQYQNGATNTTNWNPVPTTPVQGICPAGWHIPTNAEFGTLFTYLGGQSVAGGKIKETGFAHFQSPNTGATNSSGFTAIPSGLRWDTGIFYYSNLDANLWTVTSGTPTTTSVYYGGANYAISAATNGQFYKKEGLSVRCMKTVLTVPDAPTNLTGIFGLFSSSVNLSWTAPTNNGGSPITSYLIEYKQVSSSVWSSTTSTTTTKTITGLVAGNSYDYRVSAVNAIGTGVPASITAPAKITVFSGTPGNGQVTLNWIAPANGGSSLTNYIIDYKPTSAFIWSSITIPSNFTTKTIINLTNGLSYDFRVRAWGSSAGVWSDTISKTPVAPPVAGVSIAASFNGTVVVLTATPTNGGTTPTYQWKKNGTNIPGATNSTYTYNPAIGESISCVMTSNLSSAIGSPTTSNIISPPAKVTGLTATPGNGQVTLNWTTPANGGSPITTYAVRYKPSSSSTFVPFPHPASTTTSIVVTGLTNGQSYDFFVKAVNVINRNNGGVLSDIVSTSPIAFVSGNNLVAGAINTSSILNLDQETNAESMSNLDQETIAVDLFTQSLSFGKKHAEVKKLQKFLNENGYIIKDKGAGSLGNETDYFGEATRLTLVKFQKEHNIIPTSGNFGPLTRAVMNELIKEKY